MRHGAQLVADFVPDSVADLEVSLGTLKGRSHVASFVSELEVSLRTCLQQCEALATHAFSSVRP